jgi:hypothetical protein
MSEVKTFISAFPLSDSTSLRQRGMELRDYFAAQAMQGLIANRWCGEGAGNSTVAIDAYLMADAMLKARGS